MQQPSVGRIVHYVSHGTPVQSDGSQAFKSECRAAIITEVAALNGMDAAQAEIEHWPEHERVNVGLCVLNPSGMFFHSLGDGGCAYHEGDIGHDHAGVEVPARSYRGGTWHWPERV